MRLPVTPFLRTTATAASVIMLACAPLAAQPDTQPPPRDAASPTVTPLKHLPAGPDELVFRGERTSRRFSVYLSRSEADRASAFQLALLNTVAVLPERSSLKLTVNGHVLSVLPVQSPNKIGLRTVKVPAGVLLPGPNTIEITVGLTHRVDCSVTATYELWASLDPAQTGIVTQTAAAAIRSLDDIASEPLAEDGTTRIHVRMADGAQPEAIAQAGRTVAALVRRANLVRPIVDIGPDVGQGAGFDVVLTAGAARDSSAASLRVLGREEAVTLGRDAATDRLVVLVSSSDGSGIDSANAAPGDRKPEAAMARPVGARITIDAGTRRTFAELGLAAENFAGRHLLANADITLPPDFYPANYDKARLLIDGAHAASLDVGSELIFRVNGTLVSSKRLSAGTAEQFRHDLVELPLRFFHPGHNELAIEGITSSPVDQQCDLLTTPAEARLSIAGTSELEFPAFAHLETLPQIPAALSRNTPAGGSLQVYLPNAERGPIGTALTVLANMATMTAQPAVPIVHLAPPQTGDLPGVVIASAEQLPESLATPLHRLGTASAPVLESPLGAGRTVPVGDDPLQEAANANQAKLMAGWDGVVSLLRDRGFFFSDRGAQSSALPLTARSLLIGALPPDRAAASVGGLELPQFTRDASQWLVITAKTDAVYEAGIARLVANGQWPALSGQAVSLDLDTNQLRSEQPSRITYVMPDRFVFSDVRPILGGILSNNIMLSFLVLIGLMGVLGVSTHVLVRRAGAK